MNRLSFQQHRKLKLYFFSLFKSLFYLHFNCFRKQGCQILLTFVTFHWPRKMSDSLKLRSDGLRIERGGGMRLVGRKSRARTDGLRVVRETMSSKASNEGPGDDSRMLEHCAAHTSSRNTASRPASCMSREQSCTRRDAHWGCNRQITLLIHWDIAPKKSCIPTLSRPMTKFPVQI